MRRVASGLTLCITCKTPGAEAMLDPVAEEAFRGGRTPYVLHYRIGVYSVTPLTSRRLVPLVRRDRCYARVFDRRLSGPLPDGWRTEQNGCVHRPRNVG